MLVYIVDSSLVQKERGLQSWKEGREREKKERGMKEKVERGEGKEGGGALKRLTLAWTISPGSPSWGAILRGALASGPWALGHGMP